MMDSHRLFFTSHWIDIFFNSLNIRESTVRNMFYGVIIYEKKIKGKWNEKWYLYYCSFIISKSFLCNYWIGKQFFSNFINFINVICKFSKWISHVIVKYISWFWYVSQCAICNKTIFHFGLIINLDKYYRNSSKYRVKSFNVDIHNQFSIYSWYKKLFSITYEHPKLLLT